MKKPLQFDLLQNAQSFVVEALRKAIAAETDHEEWKFAILHIVQAIELSLKEFLRKQHPFLIYTNVDKPKHTVSLDLALERLKRLVSFEPEKEELKALNLASGLRDNIVHHEFNTDTAELKPAFARLFGFLVDFHRDHLDGELEGRIPRDLWIAGVKIRDYGKELFRRAKARLEADDLDDDCVIACPKCGWRAMTAFGHRQDTCYVCGHTEHLVICARCNKIMIFGEHEEMNGKEYCYECMEYLSDDYWYESERERRG